MSTDGSAGLADPDRLRALRATGLLGAVPDPAFDRLTRLATRTVGAPVSLVTAIDADRQYNYSSSGIDWAPQGAEAPLARSFCSVVVRRAAPFVTNDIEADPVAERHPGLRGSRVRAYAGFPLTIKGDFTVGALCAADDRPRAWSEAELATLQDIAAMVIDEIELHNALRLSELRREELERAAASIRTLHGALDDADAERLEGQQAALRVAADLAHELRTPLYAIRMLAEDMAAAAPEALHGDLGRVDSTTAEALAVIDHHLELARASSGQVVRVHEVEMTKLFEALRGMLEPLARRPGVALRFSHPEGLPPLWTDGVKLAQILRNLTTNALRHTTAGEIVVSAEPGPQDTLLFHVRDTGEGIATEHHERIFSRGEQITGGVARVGVGLGLPLARRMAEMIGGSITLSSVLGEGSCFTLHAPVRLETAPPGVTLTTARY